MPVAAVTDTLVNSADSVVAPYLPQHIEHFTAVLADTTAGDTLAPMPATTVSIDTMETPRTLPPSPMSDNTAVGVLLAAVVFVLLSYRVGRKYFDNIFHNLFSTRRRENLFEDHTFNETQILAALVTLMCVCEGFATYLYLSSTSWGATMAGHAAVIIPVFAASALAYYLLQLAGYFVIGHIFLDDVECGMWLDGYKASQALLGLLLLPVVIVMASMPVYTTSAFIIAAALFFSVRIAFVYKGFRIFFVDFSSCLAFILYLCAVEIAPVVALMRVVRLMCEFFWT